MNIKLLTLLVPGIFLLITSSAVHANGFYVGASAMQAEFNDDFEDGGYTASIGKYIGEGKRVSLEVGFTDFGDSGSNGLDAEFDAKAVQFSAVGYLPLSPRAGIYGRVGAERIKTEASANNLRVKLEETNPYFGVGGYYNVTENIDVRVEYQRHEILDDYVDTYNAGITVETF